MQGDVGQFAPQAKHLAQRGMVAVLVDYRMRSRHGTTPLDAIADAKSAVRWVRSRDASPLHHLRAGLPPTLILHGKADAVVPYADVDRLCAESTALGNQCRLVGYEGASHGFFNPGRGEKWYRETLLETDRFLTDLAHSFEARDPGTR